MVFTLGSAAVLTAGNFYESSANAAMQLGIRAVLLIGADPRNRPQTTLPESICVAEYAPYSALFNRAALVVHQGGVGTTAQCLRAGKPMLIMPFSHDQPDNGRRMRRLQVAQVIARGSYTPQRVARRLRADAGPIRSLPSGLRIWPAAKSRRWCAHGLRCIGETGQLHCLCR